MVYKLEEVGVFWIGVSIITAISCSFLGLCALRNPSLLSV